MCLYMQKVSVTLSADAAVRACILWDKYETLNEPSDT